MKKIAALLLVVLLVGTAVGVGVFGANELGFIGSIHVGPAVSVPNFPGEDYSGVLNQADGSKIPLDVEALNHTDPDEGFLGQNIPTLQVTSLQAILDETRDNGIPEAEAQLTRDAYNAIVEAGSWEAYYNGLKAKNAVKGEERSEVDLSKSKVSGMFNLTANEQLKQMAGNGGTVSWYMEVDGLPEGTIVDVVILNADGTILCLGPSVVEARPDGTFVIAVTTPIRGTLVTLSRK